MARILVGTRFSPSDLELIIYYLKNKVLGNTELVDDAINEIDICSYEPKDLLRFSKIKSDNFVWYFFSAIVYANSKKKAMKRSTGSGFWKPTGKDRIIKDKRGREVGIRKTLVYHVGKVANGLRTSWFMYEYHITCLPHDQTTHVLCQLEYKGEDGHNLYDACDSMVSHSSTATVMNTVPEVQVDQPDEDGLYLNDLQQTPEVQVEQPHQNDLRNPLNTQADAVDPSTSFNCSNPNPLQQTSVVQVDQPDEDRLYLNDLSYPFNVQENLHTLDAINPNLLQQTPEVQVNQPVQDGLYLNDLSNPLNIQEDLLPLGTIDPNTSFNYINPNLLQQTSEVQVEQPLQYPPLNAFDPNTDFSMDELLSLVNVQDDHLPSPNEFDTDTFFNFADDENYGGNNEAVIVQENRNVYVPKKAVSGTIIDCSSDSDDDNSTESAISTMSYQGPSSSHDSVGSSSSDSCEDPQISSADLSVNRKSRKHQRRRRIVSAKQEVKRGTSRAVDASMDKEKSVVKTAKEIMETNLKRPRFIIIGFILLVGFIGNIKYWNRE